MNERMNFVSISQNFMISYSVINVNTNIFVKHANFSGIP
jgi:hypothetical protein